MNSRLGTLLVLIVSVTTSNRAFATNTAFLPGDAFFHTTLPANRLDALEDDESPSFKYARPPSAQYNMCGFAGFWSLAYEEMPVALRHSLVKVGRHIPEWHGDAVFSRSTDPRTGEVTERQLNSPHLFIYNVDFDGIVGLKFNEKWMQHTTQYESFVTDYRFIAYEWRRSETIEPLEVEVPFELDGGKKPTGARLDPRYEPAGGPRISESVTIRGPMQLIVIPRTTAIGAKNRREVNDVAHCRNGAVVYVITVDGIVGRRERRGAWEEFDPFERARDSND